MIYRIDVRTAPPARGAEAAGDPVGEAVRQQIKEFGTHVGPVATRRIFLIDTDAGAQQVQRVARELLADPIVEQAEIIDAKAQATAGRNGQSRIEIHLKPGVMDPVAASTEMAIRDMGLPVNEVRTGRAYLIEGDVPKPELEQIAAKVLANGVIESVHFDAYVPQQFERGREYQFRLKHVAIRELSDEQLTRLSRDGHLFLSPAEMKSIQAYYREQRREPSDVELETIAQTWSEHCVHKTLKSAVDVEVRDETGKVMGNRRYGNLIKETIFDSTMELMGRERESDEAGSRAAGGDERRSDGGKGGESPLFPFVAPSLRRFVASFPLLPLRLQGQRGRRRVRRCRRGVLQGRDAQPPQRHRTVRWKRDGCGWLHPRHPRNRSLGAPHREHRRVLRRVPGFREERRSGFPRSGR